MVADGIFRCSSEPKPQNVHRRAEFLHRQTRLFAHDRAPAVRADDEIGAHFNLAVGSLRTHADHAARFLDEAGDLGFHHQSEIGIRRFPFGEEIEKIPLRHERDKAAAGRQVAEVRDGQPHLAELRVELVDLLMRQLEKLVEQSQLVHHLEGRGMNGIAAKIAQEIAVLFQHQDFDPGARQQIAQHHAGRPAAGDAAAHGNFLRCHGLSLTSAPAYQKRWGKRIGLGSGLVVSMSTAKGIARTFARTMSRWRSS